MFSPQNKNSNYLTKGHKETLEVLDLPVTLIVLVVI